MLIGGFYGSHLKHVDTNALLLSSFQDLFSSAKDSVLSTDAWSEHKTLETKESHVAHRYISHTICIRNVSDIHCLISILDKVGLFDMCGKLIQEMKDYEACSEGKLRFHTYAYDWRKDLHHSSAEFSAYLDALYEKNNQHPIYVIARERIFFDSCTY